MSELDIKIKESLNKEITTTSLLGKGACNYAYLAETEDEKFIVKVEREEKEFTPQNSLIVEANVAHKLFSLNLSLPTAEVVFISEQPEMYGYKYINGDTLKNAWVNLNQEERKDTCFAIGKFHAEIGKGISKEECMELGITIDESSDLHPEVLEEYEEILKDKDVPESLKELAKKAKGIFDETNVEENHIFQFLHNDAHHENILIDGKQLTGFIDYGNAEYGEVAKEFSRYIRDFPDYFQYIIESYEKESGNKLNRSRLITNAFISGLMEIVEDYKKGGEKKVGAEKSVETYRGLIDKL